MAEEIRLEVTRKGTEVWLNRMLGGHALGSLWMPAAEWDAFLATREARESDRHWNDAVDWLLNSRHTGDPDIQAAFWGMVDGKLTREQADSGVFVLDADGEVSLRADEDGGS